MKKKYIWIFVVVVIVVMIFKPFRKKSIRLAKQILAPIGKVLFSSAGCPNTKFSGAEDEFFSQFYEDYILSNIFADVERGFYVDVGANNPNASSVTLYFYKKGWHGMNFEPQKRMYDMLVKYRVGDINIQKAVSDQEGKMAFYLPEDGSPIGTLDPKIMSVESNSYKIEVDVTTLTKEFVQYGIKDIDFIKIDVEGFEDKVVAGLDLKKFRPKVIMLEYISPTTNKGYINFEPGILAHDYIYGADDGLNRYYYRKESPELGDKFKVINRCVNLDIMAKGL